MIECTFFITIFPDDEVGIEIMIIPCIVDSYHNIINSQKISQKDEETTRHYSLKMIEINKTT